MDLTFAHSYADGRALPPSFHYPALRERPSPFWSTALNGWIVTDYAGVKGVLTRSKDFHNGDSPQRAAFGHDAMLFHDGGVHNRLRSIWASELLPEAIARRGDQLTKLAHPRGRALLERLAEGGEEDLVAIFQDYTTDVITAFMDVPDDRRDDFQRWNAIMNSTAQLELAEGDPRLHERARAKCETYAYLDEQIADRESRFARGEHPCDLVALMVAGQADKGFDRAMVADNLLNLFIGALDTTVRWMGNIVLMLHEHEEVLEELVRAPDRASAAFEEVLRHQSVVQVTTRHVGPEGAELNGVRLDPGQMVYVMPGIANRDATVFPDPDRFDIHRRDKGQKPHLGFGFGMHQCLGMHAARGEVLAFFRPLLTAMRRWEIAEVDYGESWSLWGPAHLKVTARR